MNASITIVRQLEDTAITCIQSLPILININITQIHILTLVPIIYLHKN